MAMAMANRRNVSAMLVQVMVAFALVATAQAGYSGSPWISNQAHATFYGGADASGTQGMLRWAVALDPVQIHLHWTLDGFICIALQNLVRIWGITVAIFLHQNTVNFFCGYL